MNPNKQVPNEDDFLNEVKKIEDEKYRMALLYQYLIAGNADEVCGKYAPKRRDHQIIEVQGTRAVLFIVKTARHGGKIRGCLLPLDDLLFSLLDYIEQNKNESLFDFHVNHKTSKRYYQWMIQDIFADFKWVAIDYDKVLHRDGWTKKLKEINEEETQATFNFPHKIVPFTSSSIRKLRKKTLIDKFGFHNVEINAFIGWTIANENDIEFLVDVGKIYFSKLLA